MPGDYKARIQIDSASVGTAAQSMELAASSSSALSQALSGNLIGAIQSVTYSLRGLELATRANVFFFIASAAVAAGVAIRQHMVKESENARKKLEEVNREYEVLQKRIEALRGGKTDPISRARDAIGGPVSPIGTADALRREYIVERNKLDLLKESGAEKNKVAAQELKILEIQKARELVQKNIADRAAKAQQDEKDRTLKRQQEETAAAGNRRSAERDLEFSRLDPRGRAKFLRDEIIELRRQADIATDSVRAEEKRAEALRKTIELESLITQIKIQEAAAAEKIALSKERGAKATKEEVAAAPSTPAAGPSGPTYRPASIDDEFDFIHAERRARRTPIRMSSIGEQPFHWRLNPVPGGSFSDGLLDSAFARSSAELAERRGRLRAADARVVSSSDEQPVNIGPEAMRLLRIIADNSEGIN